MIGYTGESSIRFTAGGMGISVAANEYEFMQEMMLLAAHYSPTIKSCALHIMPTRIMDCSEPVQEKFEALVQERVISQGELFGEKICAALDRQHLCDLFDVKLMLDRYGLTDEIRLGMIAALVSHRRPII